MAASGSANPGSINFDESDDGPTTPWGQFMLERAYIMDDLASDQDLTRDSYEEYANMTQEQLLHDAAKSVRRRWQGQGIWRKGWVLDTDSLKGEYWAHEVDPRDPDSYIDLYPEEATKAKRVNFIGTTEASRPRHRLQYNVSMEARRFRLRRKHIEQTHRRPINDAAWYMAVATDSPNQNRPRFCDALVRFFVEAAEEDGEASAEESEEAAVRRIRNTWVNMQRVWYERGTIGEIKPELATWKAMPHPELTARYLLEQRERLGRVSEMEIVPAGHELEEAYHTEVQRWKADGRWGKDWEEERPGLGWAHEDQATMILVTPGEGRALYEDEEDETEIEDNNMGLDGASDPKPAKRKRTAESASGLKPTSKSKSSTQSPKKKKAKKVNGTKKKSA